MLKTTRKFEIHSICVVKNEVDIIEYCIKQALEWSDYIYLYDGESTDGTWDKIMSLASDRVIPWKQDGKVFQESLRAEVFNAFKSRVHEGDWWCHLDADEFYMQSPKDFLSKVPYNIHVVWGIAIEYYLTDIDLLHLDFNKPINHLLTSLKYYKAENSEPRFFRHRSRLKWNHGSWPKHMGIVYSDRILYKHYKYRTPEQIQERLNTRRANRNRGFPGWEHAFSEHWHEKVCNHKDLFYDFNDCEYTIDTNKLPQHKESFLKRLGKQIMHRLKIWP